MAELVVGIDIAISVDLKDNPGHIHGTYAYRLEDGGRRAKSIMKTIILIPDEGTRSHLQIIYTFQLLIAQQTLHIDPTRISFRGPQALVIL